MKNAITIHAVNRLAGILDSPDGIAVEDMVANAEKRVARLAGDLHRFVGGCVDQIVAIHGEGEEALFAASLTVGDLAMNIAEVATGPRLEAVGEVARGIRAMVDSLVAHGVWHTDALNLHITSLDLLYGDQRPADAEVARVLTDLREMRLAVGATD